MAAFLATLALSPLLNLRLIHVPMQRKLVYVIRLFLMARQTNMTYLGWYGTPFNIYKDERISNMITTTFKKIQNLEPLPPKAVV